MISISLHSEEYDYKKIMNQYEYMSVKKAMIKWNLPKLDTKKQSVADFKKMIDDKDKTNHLIFLAQQKKYIGSERKVVTDALGDPSSYFFSEQNASYELVKIDDNQWVVSFEVSSDQIVRSIKIAKKCCYEVQ